MRTTLNGLGLGDVQLQQFGAPTDVLIRVAQQPGGEDAQQAAVAKVRQALGDEVEYRRVEVVGPRVSTELLAYGTLGLVLAIFGILIYLWFRFEWQFALGAMIANVHDLVLTIGFMSLTQIDFDLTSIAALLTILGYSLNDTVVIYDRIREMLRRYKRMPMADLLNISVNSTLSRSIITHVTVTLALLALLLFGGQAIHSFTATMMFGVVLVGTYTSVFIAAPILIYLGVGTGREAGRNDETDHGGGRRRAGRICRAVAPIDAYGKGGFRFAGMSHRGSLLCLPSGIWAWPVAQAGRYRRGGARAGVRRGRRDRPVPDRRRAASAWIDAGRAADALSRVARSSVEVARTGNGGQHLQHPARRGPPRRRRPDRGGVSLCRGSRCGAKARLGAWRTPSTIARRWCARATRTAFSPRCSRRRSTAARCFALYAFNLEIARTRELAREPMPGEIRLQWWRDVLAGAGRARRRPIRSPPRCATRSCATACRRRCWPT